GAVVEAWQLDELVSEVTGSTGGTILSYTGGMLDRIHQGRPELGDRPMRGILYVAHNGFPIFTSSSRGAAAFFATVLRTCFRLAGEEYPDFTGSPSATASSQAWGQRALAAAGGTRGALARRYMPCLTPGLIVLPGFGGNVHG